jgi:hypothetical protein
MAVSRAVKVSAGRWSACIYDMKKAIGIRMRESLSWHPRGLTTAMRQVVCLRDYVTEGTLRCVNDICRKKLSLAPQYSAATRRPMAWECHSCEFGGGGAGATVVMKASGGGARLD